MKPKVTPVTFIITKIEKGKFRGINNSSKETVDETKKRT